MNKHAHVMNIGHNCKRKTMKKFFKSLNNDKHSGHDVCASVMM